MVELKTKRSHTKKMIIATVVAVALLIAVKVGLLKYILNGFKSTEQMFAKKGIQVVPEEVARQKDVGFLLTQMTIDEVADQILEEVKQEASKIEKQTGKKVTVSTKEQIRESLREWEGDLLLSSLVGKAQLFEYQGQLWSVALSLQNSGNKFASGDSKLTRINKVAVNYKVNKKIPLVFAEESDTKSSSTSLTNKARVFVSRNIRRQRLVADSILDLNCIPEECTGNLKIESGDVVDIKDYMFINVPEDSKDYKIKLVTSFKAKPKPVEATKTE